MRRSRDIAVYIAAALSGIAAAYVLNEWVRHWWDLRHPPRAPNDEPKSAPPQPADTAPTGPNDHARQTRSLPSLRTHSLPPPLPNGRTLFSGASLGMNPDAMTSSVSLHTSNSLEEDDASQATTSEMDAEPFVDVLSPPPAHVISRRHSVRNHDLFAASHISFSELGNLVAPENESH